ncbi:ACT domain-containing protein [Clostridium fallax]|uniref:UPF0735 ACT domain-containing protein SAMN05443638_10288 n=1 Tax=Clostridium fallax TaxID=1533 RepID=A0A1M4T9W4_9CLOT|nr:ACT domain-containing protein [Clostridium fallax]SHE41215.1 chorismate mutase [Clostridium fallax]SQB22666.1 ACT domain protein pheB [Clostridium fallax]
MSEAKYYIVNEKVLPEIFIKVIKVKELIYTGKVKDITEGVKKVGISRSAYYKYKDYIFPMSEGVNSKKVTLAILLTHKSGALSRVLDTIADVEGNILTINQDIAINMTANVTVTIDISSMKVGVKTLMDKLDNLETVIRVTLFAVE